MPRMTNTYLENGSYNPKEIITSVKRGIYAVNFSGGQVDITSGKFVFSASEGIPCGKWKNKEPTQRCNSNRQWTRRNEQGKNDRQ